MLRLTLFDHKNIYIKNKILFIIIFILLTFSIVVLKVNPILFKCLIGSARNVGKPIKVKVYVNNQLNDEVKVFHVDKHWNNNDADYYILNCNFCERNYFIINKSENFIACPVSTNKRDYDFILGYLFQSEVGAHYVLMNCDIKGLNFKSNLIIKDNEITFDLPSLEKSKIINFKLVFNKL